MSAEPGDLEPVTIVIDVDATVWERALAGCERIGRALANRPQPSRTSEASDETPHP